MNTAAITAIIRQRGQLTIPDRIRSELNWVDVGSIVKVKASADEIKILPYDKKTEKEINWKKLWEQIKLVRSFKGKRGSLSEFIIKDRESH